MGNRSSGCVHESHHRVVPHQIRRPIRLMTHLERCALLRAAQRNLFALCAEEFTGAMSARQWAADMPGDGSYAGAPSLFRRHTGNCRVRRALQLPITARNSPNLPIALRTLRQAVASPFTFRFGSILATRQTLRVPLELVTPVERKRALGLTNDKCRASTTLGGCCPSLTCTLPSPTGA